MPEIHNPMCSGSHCLKETGTVKVYPLGGSGNLILCSACWLHENRYRRQRRQEVGIDKANFPNVDWDSAETYGS